MAFERLPQVFGLEDTPNAQSNMDALRRLVGTMEEFLATAIPVGIIMPAYLTAAQVASEFDSTGLGSADGDFYGWAICNGNNDTPNLDGKFPRFEVSAAGGTGGSDSSAHTHGAGTYVARLAINSGNNDFHIDHVVADTWQGSHKLTTSGWAANTTSFSTGTDVQGTSGAASATDNRPAYYELVPLMRVKNIRSNKSDLAVI